MKNIEIKAYIIDKKNRNFWYVKYQMIFENEIVKKEESSKVLKTEKTLKFMQTKYLPAWTYQKLDKYQKEKNMLLRFLIMLPFIYKNLQYCMIIKTLGIAQIEF